MAFQIQNIFFCLIFVIRYTNVTSKLIDGDALSQELYKVTNEAIGVTFMQNVFDNLQYTSQPLDGADIVTKISGSLSATFGRLIEAVKALKETVEQEYTKFKSTQNNIQECCKLNGYTYDPKFRANVSLSKACVSVSDASTQTLKYPTQAVEQAMINNYNSNPGLLWQYFGGEDGTYINYPAVKTTECNSYDPRYRPFYVSAATPVAKDVVVIIDTSGSMNLLINSKSLLQTAKEAAITVVETLNSFDRVTVIGFSSSAKTLTDGCYQNKLALATEFTKTTLKNFINSLQGTGNTNYEDPLRIAFGYLSDSKESIQGEKRDQVILFLTDGEKTVGGNPLDAIKEGNEKLGNRVVIFTYGLGDELSQEALNLLKQMANQASNNATYGEVKRGKMEHIQEPNKLRTAMGSYYNLFSAPKEKLEPIFSVPYVDLFSKTGLITSVCLPVYHEGNLIGVTCTDIKLTDLLTDITYFQQGELSYAFIIDGKGRTLMHPLLPLPRGVKQEPVIIDILELERTQDVKDVIISMKRGGASDKAFKSLRTYSRGVVLKEGIKTVSLQSHYYWKQVPNSNFSLCIVIGNGDTQRELPEQEISEKGFVYHRLDLQSGPWKACRHFARYASKDSSSVMLTPGAFKKPYSYLDTEETRLNVIAYEKFLRGESYTNPGLKDSIINSIAVTFKAEAFWKEAQEATMFAVWRYIGSMDGFFRMYPASEIPKDYDHKKRPWFRTAVAQTGPNVVTPPYIDAFGAGYVLTMARKVYKGLGDGGHSDQTEAIMGADMVIHYVYYMMLRKYEICRNKDYSCILIDNSGFIIIHPDFTDTSIPDQQVEDLHLVAKEGWVNVKPGLTTTTGYYEIPCNEGDIARDMVSQDVLTQQWCINFDTNKQQKTYRVSLSESKKDGIDRMSAAKTGYELRPVAGSNVFIILKKNNRRQSTCCSNNKVSPDSVYCSSSICDCLCYKNIKFDYCLNLFNNSRDASPTCAAKSPSVEGKLDDESQKIKSLPSCFDPKCCSRTNEADCYSVAGCSWCTQNEKELLRKPFCDLREICMFGRLPGNKNCSENCGLCIDVDKRNTTDTVETGSKTGIIVGAVFGTLILIIIVIVIIFVVCFCRKTVSNTNHRKSFLYSVSSLFMSNNAPQQSQQLQVIEETPRTSNIYDEPTTGYDSLTTFSVTNDYAGLSKNA